MDQTVIVSRIIDALPGAAVAISGEDCSFAIDVTWSGFASQRLLQRQQVVLRLFDAELTGGTIHALSVVAKTPEERARELVHFHG